MNKKLKLDELGRISAAEFKELEKSNFVVVLDNIRSAHNVGSFFRTSDAFAVEKIFLCGITPQPPHRDIRKTALGASKTVSWEHYEDTITLVKMLKKKGYSIASIEQTSEAISLEKWRPKKGQKKWALIFGNEVDGVQQDLINISELSIEIPQFGTKHSFNVSVSGGIVLWEFFKKKNENTLQKPH